LKTFLERILGRPEAPAQPRDAAADAASQVRPHLPPGRRLYCIGDIHGRLDLLEELHGMIRRDSTGFEGSKGIVYLGDYIDRGAHSRQVLDLLIEQPMEGFEAVPLLGNHEQTLLDFLDYPQSAAAWLDYGGQATLMSYGIGPGRMRRTQQVESLRDELEEKLPPAHLEFLKSCRLLHSEGSYCFVHAGIRPGVALQDQQPQDLMWIREEFIRSREDHGVIVVHGHSITEEVEWRPNRIGIDTGAYASGLLTALVLEGEQQRLLQTGRGPDAEM
jgi:serine/threonine protein phosphatase 1